MYCVKLWNKHEFVPFESHNSFNEVASASGWGVDWYVVNEYSQLLADPSSGLSTYCKLLHNIHNLPNYTVISWPGLQVPISLHYPLTTYKYNAILTSCLGIWSSLQYQFSVASGHNMLLTNPFYHKTFLCSFISTNPMEKRPCVYYSTCGTWWNNETI